MATPSLNLLSSSDFIPEKYVRELSQNYIGGPELVLVRSKIQSLSEQTSANLKKNVYQNYMQFIDTAKEISHLESEMYQLSHLLSEQKSLLGNLSTTSVLGEETQIVTETDETKDHGQQEEQMRQKISAILERVEGCSGIVDICGRILLHEGDLLELDFVDNTVLKTVHCYLFADGLMVTSRNSKNRALMRYKFDVLYELGSLAIVNVRDLGNIKHAFKVLAFPDTRIFQCSSNSTKKEWLDKFDQAKKARLTQEQQKRESVAEASPSRSTSIEANSLNPFEVIEEEVNVHPEWFTEAPEEMDVLVAQRHFEEALSLLQKTRDYITQVKGDQPDHILNDTERKIEARHVNLTEVLMKELEVNPDKSLQGGLRAARRAVRLLNQLGRSTQCCELFLKLCSSMLKTQCKRVKREGSTIMYIKHLSSVVFTNLCLMTEEFLRAFPDYPNCASAYIVWTSNELGMFTAHFIKQVFMPQRSISTLTECVLIARTQCERLGAYGIDLCYQFDGALRTPITKVFYDTRDKLCDAVKLKAAEDRWIPMNLKSKSALMRCLQEYAEVGLKLETYVTGDCWLQLTPNVIAFTKLFLSLLEDCLKLKTAELLYTIDETLHDVYEAELKYVEQSLQSDVHQDQREFIKKNADFLLGPFLGVIQETYESAVGFRCPALVKLENNFSKLKGNVASSKSNIYKYSSNEYL